MLICGRVLEGSGGSARVAFGPVVVVAFATAMVVVVVDSATDVLTAVEVDSLVEDTTVLVASCALGESELHAAIVRPMTAVTAATAVR